MKSILIAALALCLLPACSRQHRSTADILVNSTLPACLYRFRIDNGRYPTTGEGLQALLTPPAGLKATWKGPYIMHLVRDPWNNPIIYKFPSSRAKISFDLISLGPDKIPSRDDILNEK